MIKIQNQRSKIKIGCLALAILLSTSSSFAKVKNFEVSVDREMVALGQKAQLFLTFYGTQDIPAPEVKDIDGFQVEYLGPSTMMSVINGRVSSSITHKYILIPLRVGSFELGPFTFSHSGDTYISGKVRIEAVEEPLREEPSGYRETKPDISDRIFLVLSTDKTEAYISELIPVKIKLYINRLAVRDIQYPMFEQEGFSRPEFKKPKQYREYLSGVRYDVIEFKTQIFGTKTGTFRLGPAKTKCNLVLRRERRRRPVTFDDFFGGGIDDSFFDDFFSHYETYPIDLKSTDIPITILPLPKEGKPEDFQGAVGDYQFILKVDPKEVEVGDPITLKMSIYGKGNFNTVRVPNIVDPNGFKVYEPTMKQEENSKVFEQIIIPETDEVKETPRISFSFFNPGKKIYKRIVQLPKPITVKKAKEAKRPKIVELPTGAPIGPPKEILGRDIIYIKDSIGALRKRGTPLYKMRLFLYIQLLPILLFISVLIVHSRVERLRKDVRYARLLRAPKKARRGIEEARRLFSKRTESGRFYGVVFKTLQGYLGDRLHLPSAGITKQVVYDILKPKGLDEDILKKLEELFEDSDLARYAPSGLGPERMKVALKNLEEVINYFERTKI